MSVNADRLVRVRRSAADYYYNGTGLLGLCENQIDARRLTIEQARDVAKRLREEVGDAPRIVRLVPKNGGGQ